MSSPYETPTVLVSVIAEYDETQQSTEDLKHFENIIGDIQTRCHQLRDFSIEAGANVNFSFYNNNSFFEIELLILSIGEFSADFWHALASLKLDISMDSDNFDAEIVVDERLKGHYEGVVAEAHASKVYFDNLLSDIQRSNSSVFALCINIAENNTKVRPELVSKIENGYNEFSLAVRDRFGNEISHSLEHHMREDRLKYEENFCVYTVKVSLSNNLQDLNGLFALVLDGFAFSIDDEAIYSNIELPSNLLQLYNDYIRLRGYMHLEQQGTEIN